MPKVIENFSVYAYTPKELKFHVISRGEPASGITYSFVTNKLRYN